MSISRRKFIKGAAAVAGATTMGAMLPTVAQAHVQIPSKWDLETDVLIIGYGGAGASAAIEAADAGAKVILLEKQVEKTHYSNTRMSGGKYHTVFEGYDKEALKQYAIGMFSGYNLPWKLEGEEDPTIADGLGQLWADYIPTLRKWLQSIDPKFNPSSSSRSRASSGATFKNFPGAEGSKYTSENPSFTGVMRSTTPTKDKPYLEKEAGEALYALLNKGILDRKDKITIMYETRAIDLLQADNGEIVGARANNKGKVINIKAKRATILTAGGYEYNFDMRRAFCEGQGIDGWAFYGTTANEGDGIAMAMRIGAGLAKVGKAASRFIGAAQQRHNGLRIGFSTPAVGRANAIMVNTEGNRFLGETKVTDDPSRYFSYKEAVRFNIDNLHYPNNPAWFIMDSNLVDSAPIASTDGSTPGYDFIPWSEDNQDAVRRGWVLKADTLEALGTQIDKHPDNKGLFKTANMIAAVKRFNELCAAGEDTDFGRRAATMKPVEKGPFYAMPLYAGGPNTKGGVMCNAARRVLQWGGKVIPRLYSAGEMSSCLKFVYQSGGNVTECMVMGRAAGRNAAAEKPQA